MHMDSTAPASSTRSLESRSLLQGKSLGRSSVALAALLLCSASYAIDFGPFRLTGVIKVEDSFITNYCRDCQRLPDVNRQFPWADETVPGRKYGPENTRFSLFSPFLEANVDVGRGFKVSGLINQRWRDGKEDVPGYLMDKNASISHEEYGSLTIGTMRTRAWSVADYPYGSNIGASYSWAGNGASYGVNTNAIRYMTRPFDVADGELVLEATYDRGNTDFKIHKPRFIELYSQFHKGPLVVDAMYQDARNGRPVAAGQSPFTSLTPDPADDAKLGSSGQSMAMIMARYQLTSKVELTGGVRRNRWTGAYGVILGTAPSGDQWNVPFNVDWNGTLGGVTNPGYPATNIDTLLGVRYITGPWSAYASMVYLGKAKTANPTERGQGNSALMNHFGVNYDVGQGFSVYGSFNMLHYAKIGLAPLSLGANSFSGIDSRITKSGSWVTLGAAYNF